MNQPKVMFIKNTPCLLNIVYTYTFVYIKCMDRSTKEIDY